MSFAGRITRAGARLIPLARRAYVSMPQAALYRPIAVARGIKNPHFKSASSPLESLCQMSTASDHDVIFHVEEHEDFQAQVKDSQVPVLVDFHADWCAPCRNLGPRLDAKVEGQRGKLHLVKINVDHAGDIAAEFDVRAIPTVIAFKKGAIVHRFEGDVSDEHLDRIISDLTQVEANSS